MRFFNNVRALFGQDVANLFLVAAARPIDTLTEEPQQDAIETKSGYETDPGFGGPSSTPVALKRRRNAGAPANDSGHLPYAPQYSINFESSLLFDGAIDLSSKSIK